jgi:hypothetical protein
MAITALTGQFYMITVVYCEEFPEKPGKVLASGCRRGRTELACTIVLLKVQKMGPPWKLGQRVEIRID